MKINEIVQKPSYAQLVSYVVTHSTLVILILVLYNNVRCRPCSYSKFQLPNIYFSVYLWSSSDGFGTFKVNWEWMKYCCQYSAIFTHM